MPNNALQWDAHGVASLRHRFPRALRSLGAPERGRWTTVRLSRQTEERMQFTPEESPYPFIAMVPPARFGWFLTAPAAPIGDDFCSKRILELAVRYSL